MRILALAGDASALIADIRLRTPLTELCQRTGWTLTLKSFHDCAGGDLDAADVLVVQRGCSARSLRLQQRMQQRGKAVVYEIDDLLTDLPAHISNHVDMLARKVWVLRGLEAADVVSVSTRRLGNELGVAEACITPNHAVPLDDAPLPSQRHGQPVSLLFASMERLASDFIYGPLCGLQGPGLPPVNIMVVGPPAAAFTAAGVQVQSHPLMPRADFIAFARSLPNPVAVIPLESSRFASCKSAIKWFEYAEAGLPVLCSDVSPYREVVDSGRTGWLVTNEAAAWEAALRRVMADAGGRQRVAVAARQQVREHHTLAQSAQAWQRAIETAVAKAQARGPWRPPLGWRVQEAVSGALQGLAITLRQRNRERLARRKSR